MTRGLKLKFSVPPELFMRFRDACDVMETPQTDAVRMLVLTFTEMVEAGEIGLDEIAESRQKLAAQDLGGTWGGKRR